MKKQILKRILSIALALTMLFSDISVYASETLIDKPMQPSKEEATDEQTLYTLSWDTPNFSNLVIFVDFADIQEHSYTSEVLEFFGGDEESPEGLRQYLYTLSQKTLKIENLIPQFDAETEVLLPLTLENPAEYYAKDDTLLLEEVTRIFNESEILSEDMILHYGNKDSKIDWLTIVLPSESEEGDEVFTTHEGEYNEEPLKIGEDQVKNYQIVTESDLCDTEDAYLLISQKMAEVLGLIEPENLEPSIPEPEESGSNELEENLPEEIIAEESEILTEATEIIEVSEILEADSVLENDEIDLQEDVLTGIQTIDGKSYIYNDNGELQTGYFEYNEQKYYADNNGVLKSDWIKLGDVWRYFDPVNSCREVESETTDNYWYYLEDGRISYFAKKTTLVKNCWKTINKQKYYFDDQGFAVKGWHQEGAYWYYGDEKGQMVKGAYTLGEGAEAKTYYFDSNYRLSSGWKKIDGIYRYFNVDETNTKCNEIVFDNSVGWATSISDGRKCYIDKKNGPVKGWKTIGGYRYHFDSNGFLDTGLFQDGKKHYYAETESTATQDSPVGNVAKGVKKIGDFVFGFHPSKYYRLSGWQTLNGKRYYFTNDYDAVTGWYKEGGYWYYAEQIVPEGVMAKGIKIIDEHTYYFDSNYRLQTGWVKVGNIWRYFSQGDTPEECYEIAYEKDGGWLILSDGTELRKSYVNSKNSLIKGWFKENGNKYYFNSSGMLEYGWFNVGNKIYYADEQGILQEDSSTFYGWKEIEGQKYYFNSKGEMQKGLKTIEGQKYYFDSNGVMQTGWITAGKSKYFANEEGVIEQGGKEFKGWKEIEGKTYYFNSKGEILKGFQTISKQRFYFDTNGVLQSGWFTVEKNIYYGETETKADGTLKGTLAKGAREIVIDTQTGETATYVFHSSKYYRLTGFQSSGGERYYLKSDGTARTGWFTVSAKMYYAELETSENGVLKGTIARGAKEIDGETYVFHSSKYYRVTGWQTADKQKYYLDSDGTARTGWFKIGGKWYYGEPQTTESGTLKGTLAVGFKTLPDTEDEKAVERTYYFDSSYGLVTGWKTISKKTYFFNKASDPKKCYQICQGPSKTGWFVFEDGRKSYLNSKGKFVTGWQTFSKKKYYFDSAGIMQTGWCTISGKDYYFNREGVYIPLSTPSFTAVTSTDYRTVDISWKEISGARSYILQYSKDKTFSSWTTGSVSITDTTITNYRLENLDGDEKYYFRLKYTVWDGDEAYPDVTISAYSTVKNIVVRGEVVPTAASAVISECTIVSGNRNEGITVNLKASFGTQRLKSADGSYYIVETESYGNAIDLAEPVAVLSKSFDVDVNFEIGAGKGSDDVRQAVAIALMNKFALAIKNEDGTYQLVSAPMGITNPELIAEDKSHILIPVSKKGIQAVSLNERSDEGKPLPTDDNAYGSNTKHTLFNIHINDLIGTSEGNGFIAYEYKGKTYYFSNCAAEKETVRNLVAGYPQYINPNVTATNQVAVTFVLLLEYDSTVKYLIDPSARSKGHKYYTLNVREEAARETYEALFLYLGEIFGQEDCFVTHWVLGNEVNSSKAWNYQGSLSFSNYMKSYASAFRLLYNGVKAGKTGNNVYISLDNGWTAAPDTYSGKSTLDKFASYAQQENPEMLWSIAYHGYSYPLTRNDFWNDSKNTTSSVKTKYISMKNISVLINYAASLEEKYDKPAGSIRVILSEQGYNGSPNPTSQAKALARGYYMAEFNDRIDAFIIRAITDAKAETKGGLYLGITNSQQEKRIAYFIYEYMDSNLEYMAQLEPADIVSSGNVNKFAIAKKILCETNWESIIPGFDRSKLAGMH